ncbi:pentatricopeptide repeat-containing protein At2g22070-like [Prosopis cineraria]|uniref:pentatricopeptide repeat-containing protein At2g22070-like n=1 Tax=Prosopis cineraria TaxID=364024 RepID=UPI00240FABEC|nr:pentatricopeptide repeat-containing protein At2g22070-like [Prosopis cineraria]
MILLCMSSRSLFTSFKHLITPSILSCWYHSSPLPHFTNAPLVDALHAMALKNASLQSSYSANFLLTLYLKSYNLESAHKLFDEILLKDTHTWSILISGYARSGSSFMVFTLFRDMLAAFTAPNQYTLSSVFKCCSIGNNIRFGKAIHAWMLQTGIDGDVVLHNAMLDLYLKCRDFEYAKRLFKLMEERDVVSWNIMIGAYMQTGDVEKSLDIFRNLPYKDVVSWNIVIDGLLQCGYKRYALEQLHFMMESRVQFSAVTFSVALTLASSLFHLPLGRQLHGRVLKFGVSGDGFIRSSLIEMYCKCSRMDKASLILREIPPTFLKSQISGVSCNEPVDEIVSWSSMVSGYVSNGNFAEGLKLFKIMVCELVIVDIRTITSIISACANTGILEVGRQIHAYIQKVGHGIDAYVGSSLIDMYSKSGSLVDAIMIFKLINDPSVVLWTSMIFGYALHGQGRQAICLFKEMINLGITPNEVTFLGVLNACSHEGLLEEGCKYFEMMRDVYCIDPGLEHLTCMVDLYGRAGCLLETKKFIFDHCISHLSSVWKSFLSSCQLHKNAEMGKWVSEILLQVAPFDAGAYILSSNMCADNRRWDEVARVRSLMHHRGVKKHPGQSWL